MPVFIVMAAGGFSLLALMTIFDQAGDMLDDAFDAVFDIDDTGGGTRWISFYSIIAFVGFFGVGGALAQVMDFSNFPSVFFGLVSGVSGGGIAALFTAWMKRQEKSSHIKSGMVVGRAAQVTIAIPENGVGEVSIVLSEAHRLAARSADGKAIPVGATVVVKEEGPPLIVSIAR